MAALEDDGAEFVRVVEKGVAVGFDKPDKCRLRVLRVVRYALGERPQPLRRAINDAGEQIVL